MNTRERTAEQKNKEYRIMKDKVGEYFDSSCCFGIRKHNAQCSTINVLYTSERVKEKLKGWKERVGRPKGAD